MTQPSTMQAIVQDKYGSAEVLRLAEIDRPVIGDDEVLVRVDAAGLDRGTWHLMEGLPYLIRLGYGLRRPKNPVPGLDGAGMPVGLQLVARHSTEERLLAASLACERVLGTPRQRLGVPPMCRA